MLTIVFGDMVGSTAMGEVLGADSMHELIRVFQESCTAALLEHDGTLESWRGDGFMAYFGYPSDEDAAVRAVEAGMAVVGAVRTLAPGFAHRFGVDVRIRIGIHTGLVVIARRPGEEIGPHSLYFVGDAPNLASRIESSAQPNSVVISDVTQELVRGYFEVEPLPPADFRGVSRRVPTFRVLRRTTASSRYQARQPRLTPLIGRVEELRALREAMLPMQSGSPRVVALAGEPGLGKTRLLHEVMEGGYPDCDIWYAGCSRRTTAAPLQPFAQFLQASTGRTDTSLTYEQLDATVGHHVPRDATMARLAELVGVESPHEPDPFATAEQVLRETTEALCNWLVERSTTKAVVLLIDDAQWIDPTSVDLLVQLKRRAHRLCVVVAHRIDGRLDWVEPLSDVRVELHPLDEDAVARLIGCVTAADEAHVRLAAARSDGVPLFAEELGRMLERGELAELGSIPNSLHDLVLSRLDGVAEAKTLAQVGATIGRQVDLDLLAEVCELTSEQALEQSHLLAAAQVWERSERAGQTVFGFRHALIQDAAYDSQLRERKFAVHGRVAAVMQSRDVGSSPIGLATIAHHLEGAGPGRRAEAITSWAAAGFGTADAGAHVEAITHFTRGLALIGDLVDPSDSVPAELQLQLGLGASLSTTEGYGQDRVRTAFARSRDLCALLGEPAEIFPAIWGLWTYFLVRGEYATAEELASTLSSIAQSAGDPAMLIEADALVGITSYYQGRLAQAAEHLSRAASRYDQWRVVTPFQRFQHPAVAALSHLALVRWLVGDDEATCRATAARAADLAASCEAHMRWFAEEYAETFCAALGAMMDDAPYCLRHAQNAIDVCTEHGSQMFLAGAEIYKGYAQVQLGDVEEGLARLEAGCEGYLLTGARLFRPYHLSRLAIGRAASGDGHGALVALHQAVELADETGEIVHLPDVLGLRGEARRRLRLDDVIAAEADVDRASTVARSIGAARLAARAPAPGTTGQRVGAG